MIKRYFILLLLFCSSFSLFSQNFNRSHFPDMLRYAGSVLVTDSGAYSLLINADEDNGYSLLRYNSTGGVVTRSAYSIDSLRLFPYGFLSQSDSTLLVYGKASGKASASTKDLLFVAKYTTDLIMQKVVLLEDSASVMLSHELYDNKDLLVVSTNGFKILDQNLNVREDRYTITSNAYGVRLSNDSILLQTSSGFRLIDLVTNATYTHQLVPSVGQTLTQAYSDSSFAVYEGQTETFFTFRKDDLMGLDTADFSVVGFPITFVQSFENHVVALSQSGDYAVFNKQDLQMTASGSILSQQSSGSMLSRYMSLHDSIIGFATHVYGCQQTHVEFFKVGNAPAPGFHSVEINAKMMRGTVNGGAKPSDVSAYTYKYPTSIDIELRVTNTSSEFLDSLSLIFGTRLGSQKCGGLRRLTIPGVNLVPGDSAKVMISDSFDIYTNVLNSATLALEFSPLVANGKIIENPVSDSVRHVFTGLSSEEAKLTAEFSLVPSPVKDKVTLVSGNREPIEEVVIYTVTGEPVIREVTNTFEPVLSVHALKPGSYVVVLKIGSHYYRSLFQKI